MPEEKVSFATGLYKMGATLGGAFGIALNTTVFTVCQQFYSVEMSAMISFLVRAIIMILGLISAFILIPKMLKHNKNKRGFLISHACLFIYN